ncbi:hypothetical protein RSOL_286100 [Rhizoctonia solani AG-3 Rhs1AP]|nr:hypothetical protein RSOL_286100 [Rhizoctonia solani AG-3 Rhs1AP]KEP46050.1 hypothetical protein V565_221580 [Rhizoctonia solani 123E]
MIEKLLQGASGALGSALDVASKAGGSGLGGGGTESNAANAEGPGEAGGPTTEGALPAATPTEDIQPSAQPENETSSSNSNSNAAPVAEGSTRGNRPPGPTKPTSPNPKAQDSSGPARLSSGGDPRKLALKK